MDMPSRATALVLEVADVLREMDEWPARERAEVVRGVREVLRQHEQADRTAAEVFAGQPNSPARGPVLAGIDEAE